MWSLWLSALGSRLLIQIGCCTKKRGSNHFGVPTSFNARIMLYI
nr:MAG TPA: hypothetical protein [Caudoviricetes sp.]